MPKKNLYPGLCIRARISSRPEPVTIPLRFTNKKTFQMLAMRWSKQAAQRIQWIERDSDIDASRAFAYQAIDESGLTTSQFNDMLEADVLEVCIPWKDEQTDWETRIMPWEVILIQALRSISKSKRAPCIVRHLMVNNEAAPSGPPSSVIAVLNGPNHTVEEQFANFKREASAVNGLFQKPETFERLSTAELTQTIDVHNKKDASLLVHFMAIDQMLSVNKTINGKLKSQLLPHVWLPHEDGLEPEWQDFEHAASVLAGQRKHHPRLVSLSFSHTGPRLAALTVARGAHAALGFQDIADDSLRLNFFSTFYQKCQSSGWDLLAAFQETYRAISPLLRGTGIILWSRHSLLTPPAQEPVAKVVALPVIPPSITIEADVNSRLNYAVMHNQQAWESRAQDTSGPIFSKFQIILSGTPGTLDCPLPAEVTVSLHAGDVAARWHQLINLKQPSTELAAAIRVPLTSRLTRSLRESVHTIIEVEVRFQKELVFCHSYSVTLLAIDEWLDDKKAHVWLPSFVHPRDPAVIDLIRSARHDLRSLADDFHAGFDGYQSGDPLLVDRQVQAIWATIIQEWKLAYINPPPSFEEFSQRLRRPSDIFNERAGTCIDLALLLAAALEYIDVRPLLILMRGHAFIAYCREEWPQMDLFSKITEDLDDKSGGNAVSGDDIARITFETVNNSHQRESRTWVYNKDQHKTITQALDEGRIAALEATGLTKNMSFTQALAEGTKKLRRRLEFDCLIDVRHARNLHVTPLPLIFDAQGS